jgi:hypothetical protein
MMQCDVTVVLECSLGVYINSEEKKGRPLHAALVTKLEHLSMQSQNETRYMA